MQGLWKRSLGIAFCLLYLLVMAACTSSPYSRGTGEYVEDKLVSTKVKTQLAADNMTKAHQINVETFRGTVQLSGFVDSQQSADRAVEIARSIEGVQEVQNNLAIKQPQMPQQQQQR